MTIHVLHAGDGYLYLIRSVAAHDGRLAAGEESLAAYYSASGQPPGKWSGSGAQRLGATGTVTEEQMKALFGEGLHPNGAALEAELIANGASKKDALQATRLGRRFPHYGSSDDLKTLARRAYLEEELRLGRPLVDEEKLTLRQQGAAAEFERRRGRPPLDPVELQSLGSHESRREAVAGYDFVFTPVKSVTADHRTAAEPA